MENGALQNSLKAECRLHLSIIFYSEQRRLLVNELDQLPAQLGDIRATGFEHFVNSRNIHERYQQMFNRHELMTLITRLLESLIQTKFEFAT
jgi:hypothetical protein